MKDWLPLLGVVVAQVVILSLYWIKQRSDDARRWHDKRLEMYSALALAFRDAIAAGVEPSQRDSERLGDAIDRAGLANFQITLLATDKVRAAADHLMSALGAFRRPFAGDELTPLLQSLVEAKTDFDEAVRAELGISRPRRTIVIASDSVWGIFAQSLKQIWIAEKELFSRMFGIRITRR